MQLRHVVSVVCVLCVACSSSVDDDDDLTGDAQTGGDSDTDGGSDDIAAGDTDTDTDSDVDTGPCTLGQTRCDGYDQQECEADGSWAWKRTCPYVCMGGECTGQCSPQVSNTCCTERVIDGELVTQCSQYASDCTGGPGCDNPARVFIRGCNSSGQPVDLLDCEVTEWTGNEGTSAETVYNMCRVCEESGQLSCFNGQTSECRAAPPAPGGSQAP